MGSCLSSEWGGGDGGGSNRSGAGSAPSSPLLSPGSKKVRRGGSGRRQGAGGGPSLEWEVQQQLHKTPGRMFANGASSLASLFTQQGKKGTNQDAMIVWENFGSRTDTIFCGVFDGHGPYGHMVARRVRDSLPLKLRTHWDVNIGIHEFAMDNGISTTESLASEEAVSACLDNESRYSVDIEEKEMYPEVFTTLKESFLKAFKVMDKELRLHPTIDCFCSGSTAVTLVKQGDDLVIGNVGDSRAVLGTRDQNGCLVAVQLTVDLKPNLPKEEERIKQCRGRVFALRDEPEVARVWLPHNDSPGLAMARAFGDFCLKDFGLISVPEVSYRRLTEKDEFIVVATDGVWDVLSNKEVVDIVASATSRSAAARSIVESAVRAWRYKYPTSKIDDCAVVCLFLSNNSEGAAAASVNSISSNKQVCGSLSAAGDAGSNDINKQHELLSQVTASDRSDTQPSEIFTEGEGKEEPPKEQLNDGHGSHHRAPSFDGNSNSAVDGDEWSALEGVSRVNTLLTLPRFNIEGENRSAGSKSKKLV